MCVRIIYYDRFWETFFQDVGYGGTDIDEIQSTTKGINNQGSSSFTSIKTTIQTSQFLPNQENWHQWKRPNPKETTFFQNAIMHDE